MSSGEIWSLLSWALVLIWLHRFSIEPTNNKGKFVRHSYVVYRIARPRTTSVDHKSWPRSLNASPVGFITKYYAANTPPLIKTIKTVTARAELWSSIIMKRIAFLDLVGIRVKTVKTALHLSQWTKSHRPLSNIVC